MWEIQKLIAELSSQSVLCLETQDDHHMEKEKET